MRINHNDYYDWLVNKISFYNYDVNSYQLILEKLFDTEFYAIVERDDNRLHDGLELLKEYEDEAQIPFDGPYIYYGIPHDYCSVLEMMIALAQRIEIEIMYDPDYGDRTSEWFWIMMGNLGFIDMDDEHFDEFDVDRILYVFLERKYGPDGDGALFYTKENNVNMAEFEIWRQMYHYLREFII